MHPPSPPCMHPPPTCQNVDCLGVQVVGRLVQAQHVGGDQGEHRQRHAGLLAAGQRACLVRMSGVEGMRWTKACLKQPAAAARMRR
jgi:hypothetical protein